MKPIVAIVGSPNSGKSTLYNRLLGKKIAVTSKIPGTTRDRLYGEVEWQNYNFTLIDTGGLDIYTKDSLGKNIQNQIQSIIGIADLILFLIDIKQGISSSDKKAIDIIRKSEKKVIIVVNKADNLKLQKEAGRFSSLGLGEPVAVSALHGINTGDLLDKIVHILKFTQKIEQEKVDTTILMNIAIVGRPNVGKSSLLNCILGEERVIVDEKPGTTHDAIDTQITYKGQKINLIDTAGIRRKGKIKKEIEKYSVLRAIWAILKADIILLLIDGKEGPTKQDAHIIKYAQDAKCGIILAVNKWDLVKDKTQEEYINLLQQKFAFLYWAPVIFISAKTGKNVPKLWDLFFSVDTERKKKISIKKLNKVISEAIIHHPPPIFKNKLTKIYYSTQVGIEPPTFVFFVNNRQAIHFSYLRYLENKIRENFGFEGTTIKIILKQKKKTYEG